ncbi:antiterminator LoaP [Spirochaeta africana]|uniref:Transcription antiterminator n=1 Tax=Spirochaeta africana (strain ATCC 700263 / DSM 8902 / Z-7692) TaxID=889378 RepID=H9UL62_SPIAZ|nr:antiterminator LoaP [Spirochaeta africana]AFG38255.1 transcription antiterminator [Spirochaeta africana DSM 8902]
MKVYILQVHTGYEHHTAQRLQQLSRSIITDTCRVVLHSLDRELRIRARGQRRLVRKPLYPGYIFLESDCPTDNLLQLIQQVPSAVRFLQANSDITPVRPQEETMLRRLMQFGQVIPRSRVVLQPKQRIQVIQGPLQGLEGIIERVDRRRERVRVRLVMSNKPFSFDIGIEVVQPHTTDSAVAAGSGEQA